MPHLLLVHDDLAAVAALRRAIDPQWVVALAVNASDARDLLAGRPPDAVLVAAACDGGEGAALATQLAADGRTSRLPVLLLGQGGDAPAGTRALPADAGAEEVAHELRGLLGRAGSQPPVEGSCDETGPEIQEEDHRMLAEALRARAEELCRETPPSAPKAPDAGEDQADALRRQAEREVRRRAEAEAGAELARAFQDRADEEARRGAEAGGGERALRAGEARLSVLELAARRRSLAASPPAPPVPPPDALDRGRVAAQLDLVRRADYFAILGLTSGAGGDEIAAAAGRLLSELSPSRLPAGSADEVLRAELAEIALVVAEARDILGDAELRAAYQAALER